MTQLLLFIRLIPHGAKGELHFILSQINTLLCWKCVCFNLQELLQKVYNKAAAKTLESTSLVVTHFAGASGKAEREQLNCMQILSYSKYKNQKVTVRSTLEKKDC